VARLFDLARLVAGPGMNAGSTLSISGGNGPTTYRISGGYIQEDGMVPLTYLQEIQHECSRRF